MSPGIFLAWLERFSNWNWQKKGQKWYTYKLTDLGHKERFKFKTTNISAFYKTWMYNLDSWFECWLKIFHQFGAMISSKIDPFRPISNISNYLTISPIISPNFQTRSKYLYGSSKGSLKCNKSVNSFLMHIILCRLLKLEKTVKIDPFHPRWRYDVFVVIWQNLIPFLML